MNKLILSISLLACTISAHAQLSQAQLTYSYGLDTTHVGGSMRIDSFYLVEIVTGFLVNDGTSPTKFQGQRSQTLSTPLYMTDTAQLTALASSFLQDSVNLAAKISALRNQAVLLGAKARAIQHVRDSVVYGAWLWMPESIYKFPFKTDGIGFAGKKSQSAAGVITRRNFAGILKE